MYNDGSPINVEGYFIEIRAKNGDNLLVISDEGITKNRNIVTIECSRDITSKSGETVIELRFSNADGKQKRTFNILLDVESCIPDNFDSKLVISALDKLDILVDKAVKMNEDLERNINNFGDQTEIIAGYEERCKNMIKDLETTMDGLTVTLKDIKSDIKKAEDLIKTLNDTEYLQHIKNEDIHVTKSQKNKWDNYDLKIKEIINILDNELFKNSTVIDDEGTEITDDEGNIIIV
ncbi:hypothetical protein [Clostridium butyricum]